MCQDPGLPVRRGHRTDNGFIGALALPPTGVEVAKIDLKKELRDLYMAPKDVPEMVDVPPMNYLMVDGSGNPNTSQEFADAVGALYGLAYTLKFKLKRGPTAVDYVVMPLQGLWWADDMDVFAMMQRDDWKWRAMILAPKEVTPEMFEEAREELRAKKDPPALDRARLEEYTEGLSAQVMHIGPYADEAPTIERLHSFIREQGHEFRGKHHEIYLSDPNRTTPERMRTIIRQPVG
jgi:hypothetical protein